jgi:hypothetical protein
MVFVKILDGWIRRGFMNFKKKIITVFTRFFLFLFLIVFVACAGSLDTYRGKTADPNSRIALHGGSHSGVWQTDDLKVKYSYLRKPNYLQISGEVALKDKLTDASDIVQEFFLEVNFLSAAGRALGTKELAIAGYREPQTKWDFDYNFELPAKTTAMAFSYTGQMGAGAGEGLAEQFWHDPFQ